MTKEKLAAILEAHKAWLDIKPDGIRANLSEADLSEADLRWADLGWANLSGADLSEADLRWANLRWANLRWANLSGADLSEADLRWANLSGANLSEADGILSSCSYLDAHFERTADGYIAYKTFGGMYESPKKWIIAPGSVINENVNPNRTEECGCGINVAPLEWVLKKYNGDIWKVLIRWEWLPGVVVPYNTDGKIRCERVELLEVIDRGKADKKHT